MDSEPITINPTIISEPQAVLQPEIQTDIELEAAESEDFSADAPYLDVSPDQRQTETSPDSAMTTEPETNQETEVAATIVESEEKDERWKTLSNYLLVCLGSVLGLLVITFEQACSNDELSAGEIITSFKSKVVSPIFWIRLLVLTIASFAFISILGVISIDDDLLSTIQQLSRQGLYEPIIAGFLICIVILNFTASSK